jgi:uncharacterized protein YjdB
MASLSSRPFRRTTRFALVLALTGAAACNKEPVDYSQTVIVTPATATIHVGETVQLTAVNENGHPHTNPPTIWFSANEPIATVSTLGVVTGRAVGTAKISSSLFVAVTTGPNVFAGKGEATITVIPAAAPSGNLAGSR